MDSRRFLGDDQQVNDPPEECWCKSVPNSGQMKLMQDFMDHLKPSIGEEVEKGLIRVLGPYLPYMQCVLLPSSSMLPNQAEPSATRCLKLQFKGDVPDTLLTMTKLEEHAVLEVELLDEFGNRVNSGPESSLKIKIDVLDGDFDVEGRNDLTEEEYTKNITPPRKNKGALLKGDCEIKMSRGVATVSHIAFTDNSKSTRSEKYRLGAKVVKGLPPGVVVMAAVSGAIRVKERRLKSNKIRNAKQNELPQINTSTNQISNQELTNLSFFQRQPPPTPQLLPPPGWNYNNGSGFGDALYASSLSMGNIPPTNIYYDAAGADQANQGSMVSFSLNEDDGQFEYENQQEYERQQFEYENQLEYERQLEALLVMDEPLQEKRSNVTKKLISVFYMTKAATMFMVSVQQDANVPKKKQKLQ